MSGLRYFSLPPSLVFLFPMGLSTGLAAPVPSPAELPESLAAVAAPVGLSAAEPGAYNQCDSALEAVLAGCTRGVVLGVHADR